MSGLWHVSLIDKELPDSPFVRPGGSLLMMVGLPGSGKSLLVDTLAQMIDCLVIRTDMIRKHIRRFPRYTSSEMVWVYEVCQLIIQRRLQKGQRVVFDATNFQAARRERLFAVAQRAQAAIAVGHVQATEETIKQRLYDRNSDKRRDGDLSDADFSVYQWMVHAQEPIARPHLVLDTTDTLPDVLAVKLRDYWLEQEQIDATGTDYLQSNSR